MLYALTYENGKPFQIDFDIDKLLDLALQENKNIRWFPSGTYNLTPDIPTRNWDYTLTTHNNGRGILELTARSRNVISFTFEGQKMSRPRPGDKTIRLPEDQETVIIAAQTANGPRLFHILFYLPFPFSIEGNDEFSFSPADTKESHV